MQSCRSSVFDAAIMSLLHKRKSSDQVGSFRHLRNHFELRRTCRPAFYGLARGIRVGALGDTLTPAIPIRWPGSFDVHLTGPTDKLSSTSAHRILGSCLVSYRR